MVILMVKLRIKVGAKGQILIPKILREEYRIKEGGMVIIEPREEGVLVRGIEDPDSLIKWIKERRKRIPGKKGRIGELAEVDLEEEFEA